MWRPSIPGVTLRKKGFFCLCGILRGWKARAPAGRHQKLGQSICTDYPAELIPSVCDLPASTQQWASCGLGHCRAVARYSEMMNERNAPITAEGQFMILRMDCVTSSMVDGYNHSRTLTAGVCQEKGSGLGSEPCSKYLHSWVLVLQQHATDWAAETSDLYYSYSGGWTSQTRVSEGQIHLRSPFPACRQLSSHFVLRHQHPSSLCVSSSPLPIRTPVREVMAYPRDLF